MLRFLLLSRRCRRVLAGVVLFGAVTVLVLCLLLKDEEKEKLEAHYSTAHDNGKIINVYSWAEHPIVGCNGNFYGYGEEFVRLRYARINSKTKTFSIPCAGDVIPAYKFQHRYQGTPLQTWHGKMLTYPIPLIKSLKAKETTTIVVMRIEAHNLYHTMCEWYNVFLLSKLMDFNPSEVDILFLDDRPPSHMDETWTILFKNVYNYSTVNYNSVFKDLLWNIIGYESPMNFHHQTKLSFIREFRHFFLGSFKIQDTKTLNCDKLTVTLILRRDYMTHPERKNMTGGLLQRKFKNEDEIIGEIKNVFQGADLNIVVLEQISMKQQLHIVTNTDVLIGMHGAGMSHVLFLPRHAVVFEMFPNYWLVLPYFKAMSRWRHVKYFGWQNIDRNNEFPYFFTRIPMEILRQHCHAMKNAICPA